MRRLSAVWFALFLFAATSSTLSAQQSIYMLVDSIRGDQPAPHDREFKLNSFSSATTSSTTLSSATTGGVGKATFAPVKVSMRFHPASSATFNRFLAAGKSLPSVEIRLYNSSNRMFYKTVYESVYLTNLSIEGADEAHQQIEFVFTRVKWFASPDATGATPPAQIGCWDLAAVRPC